MIRAGEKGPVKIGRTVRPAARIVCLQTGHYEDLVSSAYMQDLCWGTTMPDAAMLALISSASDGVITAKDFYRAALRVATHHGGGYRYSSRTKSAALAILETGDASFQGASITP
jgi:hypothetical protein